MKTGTIIFALVLGSLFTGDLYDDNRELPMIDLQQSKQQLQDHVKALTVTIGERSLGLPANLKESAAYIKSFYHAIGVPANSQPYSYADFAVENIITEVSFSPHAKYRFLVGAHYDSVAGTVGADDNASAIAVQLETARYLAALMGNAKLDLAVKFVSFALEEPPAYNTRHMGSRMYAKKARKDKEQIDGMICLEMVGYTCHEPGCQGYPFPLMFMDYPKKGNFIGIVNNFKSRDFAGRLVEQFKKNNQLPVVKLTVPFNGWVMPAIRLSDHASFWDQGFKAVMLTDSAFYRNPYYHTAADTMDKLDFEFMAEVVQSLLLFFLSHQR
jgi:Zn-dependent M28 family amino/carboxypeptidase